MPQSNDARQQRTVGTAEPGKAIRPRGSIWTTRGKDETFTPVAVCVSLQTGDRSASAFALRTSRYDPVLPVASVRCREVQLVFCRVRVEQAACGNAYAGAPTRFRIAPMINDVSPRSKSARPSSTKVGRVDSVKFT